MKQLLTALAIAISFSSYAQFEDKRFVVAGGFNLIGKVGLINPAVGFVLNEKQFIGASALFVVGDDESNPRNVLVWFRHHFFLNGEFPLYLYLEPQLGYDKTFGEAYLIGVSTGFSIPFTKSFMFNLRAAGLNVLFGTGSGSLDEGARFNFNANVLAAELMVRF